MNKYGGCGSCEHAAKKQTDEPCKVCMATETPDNHYPCWKRRGK